ncbi:hypothetical protein EL22_27745 [Halostagnicola sp. A56]|uniref:hypothetical protein n=1 Tax=Halostagnicola sp. A56 TaxID=1495067 RepID=UPI00049F591B|nr:hypothetical protein [Halostagnicola sp. A56]KMT45777.1 hypothetical protein EL22_27745 [Halostagnicola sp. A56]
MEDEIRHSLYQRKNVIWGILLIATAGIVMQPGIESALQGEPTGNWIEDVVLGMLLLTFYFGTRLANWMDQSSTDVFGLSDWTMLFLSAVWIAACALLLSQGFSSIGILGFLLFGSVGVIGMLYKLYSIRISGSTTEI